MGPAPEQAIADLRAAPGELAFEARIGGERKRIWFRTEADLTPSADAALAACLMPAMRGGGVLRMEDAVSPRLLRTQREFQGVQAAWSERWEYGDPPLREVEVRAPTRTVEPRPPTGRVGAFFSGGVDSWATVLSNPDLTDLFFVRGLDLLPGRIHTPELVDEVERRLREAAAEVGLPLHTVETNLRDLSDPLIPWETFFGCALAAVGHFVAPLVDRVLIAGDNDYEIQVPFGANRFVDQLLSSEQLEIVDDGGRFNRMDRVRRIGSHPTVQRSLRVCWENLDEAYNCGRCRKCLMTMAALKVAGAPTPYPAFPRPLDLEALSEFSLNQPYSLGIWEDLLAAARAADEEEIAGALGKVVARRRRDVGLPGFKRSRPATPAPPGPTPAQEIADLRAGPGELSFEARIGGERKRIWFRTETAVTPPADAALAACLMPAMRNGGGKLTMSDPVSARVLRGQREFGAVQAAWSRGWHFDARLQPVEVQAPVRELAPRAPTGRVAAFFSGGVDSFAAVLDTPELTDLVFVRGLDLPPRGGGADALGAEVEARLVAAAARLELPLHVVETNVRELSDGLVPWETYFACPLAAVALCFEQLFDRVLIAGDADHEAQLILEYGAIWAVDQLWSSEQVEIVDWGGLRTREQRVRAVGADPVGRETVRVCWENKGGAYNCGRCRKCIQTMIGLEASGLRAGATAFPAELDLGLLDSLVMNDRLHLIFWEDLRETAREAGRADLERVADEFIARGKERLGFAPEFRVRESRTELAGAHRRAPGAGPSLLASPETAAKLAAARAVAVLVGGYDGSGNYGDLAQLDAALALVGRLGPGLLALPVVELGARERHAELVESPADVLYFDPEGTGAADLVPVAPPPGLACGIAYLYGGGYLNGDWGLRKLEMLAAAEVLLSSAGREGVVSLATGLQVDAGWLDALAASDRRALRGFALLGGRDGASVAALESLEPVGTVLDSADDAVAVLPRAPHPAPSSGDGPLTVALHLGPHAWVSAEPGALAELFADLLADLAARSGREVRGRPLVAYLDALTDERPGLALLGGLCAERGIELEPARVLRPAALPDLAAELAAAELALSCSYHVALTCLLLGVPTLALVDTPYYEQKAAGLAAAFGADLAIVRPGESRATRAERAAALLAAAGEGAARRRLEREAGAAGLRRAAAEREFLARAAAGALTVLGGSDRALVRRAEAAEAAAAEAHARLATLLASRSWRLTEPLRAGVAKLRERRRR